MGNVSAAVLPDEVPAGRSARRVWVAAAFLAQGWGLAVVLTHLASFQTFFGLGDLVLTLLMFAVAVLAGVGSTLAGRLSAPLSSRPVLRMGLALITVGLTVAGVGHQFAVFLLGVAAYGLGLGMVDAGENMLAVALEAGYGRSILTSFHAAWSVGGIGGALFTSLTHRWAAGTGLLVAAVVPLVVLLASWAPGQGRLRDPVASPDDAVAVSWRALTALGVALVLFYVADSAASSWSTIYLQNSLRATAAAAPLGYAAYQATSLASRIAGDHLVRRAGAVAIVRTATVIGVLGLACVVMAWSVWPAITGFAVLGLGLAVVAPLTFSAVGGVAARTTTDPAARRRLADALVARLNLFNYAGFVLGGVLTGLVGSASSIRWGYLVPLVLTAAIWPLAGAFRRARR